jgi:hypothetical protein
MKPDGIFSRIESATEGIIEAFMEWHLLPCAISGNTTLTGGEGAV